MTRAVEGAWRLVAGCISDSGVCYCQLPVVRRSGRRSCRMTAPGRLRLRSATGATRREAGAAPSIGLQGGEKGK